MKINRTKLTAIIGLVVYWPLIFIITHIPIPGIVHSAGVSDKMIHFIAYLVLAFFLWFAVNTRTKVNWLKSKVWITLAIAAVYSLADEYLQGFVGRNANLNDFLANMSGILACLIILTFLSLWPAALTLGGLILFLLPNFTTGSMFAQNAYINGVYHFFGFAIFTVLWIQVIERFLPMRELNFKWPLTAMILPIIMLAVIKLTSGMLDKKVWVADIVTALIAIILVIGLSWPTGILKHRLKQKHQDTAAYKW